MYELYYAPDSFTYNAPVKSTPVISNGRVCWSLAFGNGGGSGGLYKLPHIFLQVTHLLMIFFTSCRPEGIQYRWRSAASVAFTPECNWWTWVSTIMSFVKSFLGGRSIGNFVDPARGALSLELLATKLVQFARFLMHWVGWWWCLVLANLRGYLLWGSISNFR